MELASRFNFKDIDDKWSTYWANEGNFAAKPNPAKKPFTIVIPPPNVTGILHMGHALNNTLQDIMARYKRMSGFEMLWMPGTDHAGIATQNVVEKQLAKEGKTRQQLGRDEFTKKLWAWKQEYGDTIIHQLKKLGSSCDWDRTRFTMDDEYSEAVKEAFIHLYNKGLIYQGEYIINWCPRCHTALSDEEAEHQDLKGKLYHIKYLFKNDKNKFMIVATTRPETMLGDTAVAVNPNDERYKDLVGQTLVLPLMNREIPIIADEYVDPAFGTGAVKVTPAHDPNDFAMGKRHNLPFINVMHPDGRINKSGGEFDGQDRFTARKNIVAKLETLQLLFKIDDHNHAVGHCYRCHTIVEPYLSRQWFVKMKPLAEPAIKAVREGRITFYPDRWTKVYMNWMGEIRDWCISRQIWWGHRIPVWYCQDCNEIIVEKNAPTQCPKCKSNHLRQEEDVLDTWFSSWLWPFATLGWPKENADLKYFYPTADLYTASEIIFFWVARMIMAGYEFMGDAPFERVYIHGTVRDAQGRKMSKSLGNAIDPLEIINEYGADALRFSLIINSGQDLFISKDKFEIGRNFANKIWNASRLILMNVKNLDPKFDLNKIQKDDLPSQWIVSRLNGTIAGVSEAIENFKFSEAESKLHEFFWSSFCDWYLEIIKNRWEDKTVQNVAFKVLETSLKLMHPFMPFVTQELWANICEPCEAKRESHLAKHGHPQNKDLGLQSWPKTDIQWLNISSEEKMTTIIDVITAVRAIRAEWNIKPNEKILCKFVTEESSLQNLLNENKGMFARLAKIEPIEITAKAEPIKNAATLIISRVKVIVPLDSFIDVEKEKIKMTQEIEQLKKCETGLANRLSNESFLSKAPQDVVAKDKERLVDMRDKIKKLEETIKNFA